jgi:hypothetical protein
MSRNIKEGRSWGFLVVGLRTSKQWFALLWKQKNKKSKRKQSCLAKVEVERVVFWVMVEGSRVVDYRK